MDDNNSGFFGPVSGYGQPDIGTFTLLSASEDGFFELYRGERAGRFRVYKCLKPQWRGNLLHETMLRKEFETGYSLCHANICETYAYTVFPDLGPCIEMEWIDGVTLEEYLKKGRPDEHLFQQWAGELCEALEYIHSHQIVHRDLKPSNIMVTHDGMHLKLIDFGLADSVDSVVLKVPAGTRRFVAPEVLEGHPGDVRSDLFSLGCVLGEMTGRHRHVIAKCLRKDPSERYCSAREVREALRSRTGVWLILASLLVICVLAIAALFLLFRPVPSAPAPVSVPAPASVRDTVFIQAPPAKTPPERIEKSSSPKREEEDLERIFQQATDLFEKTL